MRCNQAQAVVMLSTRLYFTLAIATILFQYCAIPVRDTAEADWQLFKSTLVIARHLADSFETGVSREQLFRLCPDF